jgi:hypothetical protein
MGGANEICGMDALTLAQAHSCEGTISGCARASHCSKLSPAVFEQTVDISIRRSHMIEARIEVARERADILRDATAVSATAATLVGSLLAPVSRLIALRGRRHRLPA